MMRAQRDALAGVGQRLLLFAKCHPAEKSQTASADDEQNIHQHTGHIKWRKVLHTDQSKEKIGKKDNEDESGNSQSDQTKYLWHRQPRLLVTLMTYAIKATGISIVQDLLVSPSHFNLGRISLKCRRFSGYFADFPRPGASKSGPNSSGIHFEVGGIGCWKQKNPLNKGAN